MNNSNSGRESRGLQQQPQRQVDRQQQQGTDTDNTKQSNPSASQPGGASTVAGQMGDNNGYPMGEGSYEGTEKYNERTKEYLKKGSLEKDAKASKPASAKEAEDLAQAEKEGLSHTKAPGK